MAWNVWILEFVVKESNCDVVIELKEPAPVLSLPPELHCRTIGKYPLPGSVSALGEHGSKQLGPPW